MRWLELVWGHKKRIGDRVILKVKVGDALACPADVLISTANPWLNLSGGVNGAILSACGESIQKELHGHLRSLNCSSVPAATVVRSGAGALPFNHIVHAVAIDPFYDSSVQLVAKTLVAAFELSLELGAETLTSPTLATGYGPLSIDQFATAVQSIRGFAQFDSLAITLVVRSDDNAIRLRKRLVTGES